MSDAVKKIEEELYLNVFSLLNEGNLIPSKEQILEIFNMHLDIKKQSSKATGMDFPSDKINVDRLIDKIAANLSMKLISIL